MRQQLQDGDIVLFLHISPKFDNDVTIRGNVAVPGRYPWRDGMRVKDLIPSRDFLITDEFWKRQNLLSMNPNDQSAMFVQQPAPGTVQGTGAAGNMTGAGNTNAGAGNINAQTIPGQTGPLTGPLGNETLAERVGKTEAQSIKQEELKNQVKRSAAEINWEYAVIQRMDLNDLTTHLLPFNLGKAIEGEAMQNLALQPGDIVTIFSQADMQVPIAQQTKFVRLEGEFRSAGVY